MTNNKLLLNDVILSLIMDFLERLYGVTKRKVIYYYQDKANQMTDMDIGKWQKT